VIFPLLYSVTSYVLPLMWGPSFTPILNK